MKTHPSLLLFFDLQSYLQTLDSFFQQELLHLQVTETFFDTFLIVIIAPPFKEESELRAQLFASFNYTIKLASVKIFPIFVTKKLCPVSATPSA